MILEEHKNLPGYQLLDSGLLGPAFGSAAGQGYRLEQFGDFVLAKPDPAALWQRDLPDQRWLAADAFFEDGWKIKNAKMPEKWLMSNGDLSFYAELSPFKHTGIFPEQVANWDFIAEKIRGAQAERPKNQPLKFLNLFGYTGIASVAAAKCGAEVTHVDASKPSLARAKENMIASGLPENAIRWILDDCLKFARREARRGNKYDAIIMDPPAFGRGSKGEVWKFNEDLPKLLDASAEICSGNFQFLIVNAYAVSVSSLLLKNLLQDFSGKIHFASGSARSIDYGELILQQPSGRQLSTGIFARLY